MRFLNPLFWTLVCRIALLDVIGALPQPATDDLINLPLWAPASFPDRYTSLYISVICVDDVDRCRETHCLKDRHSCVLAYPAPSDNVIPPKNLYISTAAGRHFVYDQTARYLLSFYHDTKSFGISCPTGQKCVMKNTEKSKLTLFVKGFLFPELKVSWGAGYPLNKDKFTICKETYDGAEVMRLYYNKLGTGCVRVQLEWNKSGSIPDSWFE